MARRRERAREREMANFIGFDRSALFYQGSDRASCQGSTRASGLGRRASTFSLSHTVSGVRLRVGVLWLSHPKKHCTPGSYIGYEVCGVSSRGSRWLPIINPPTFARLSNHRRPQHRKLLDELHVTGRPSSTTSCSPSQG